MTSCHPVFVGAGLPNRTEVILGRERRIFPDMVALTGGAGRGRGQPRGNAEPHVTVEAILSALESPEASVARAGAFVAGRCRPETEDTYAPVEHQVASMVKRADVERLHSGALPYVEAAMTVALWGDLPFGREALLPLVDESAALGLADWLAAFYLAQMGDPAGWPKLAQLLRGEDGFSRLMAARHLVGFLPFQGRKLGPHVVDVAGELRLMIDDPDETVSQEVPALLAEADPDHAGELLQEAARNARHKATRDAAGRVLESLQPSPEGD